MKLGVTGSRNWGMRRIIFDELTKIYPSSIITGGAEGVDKVAEYWAYIHRVPCLILKPDWSLGKRGAAIRNQQIVNEADKVIAFWNGDSKGTKMTIEMAIKASKLLKVVRE